MEPRKMLIEKYHLTRDDVVKAVLEYCNAHHHSKVLIDGEDIRASKSSFEVMRILDHGV